MEIAAISHALREDDLAIWGLLEALQKRIAKLDKRSEDFDKSCANITSLFYLRHGFTTGIGWSIPSEPAVQAIINIVGTGHVLSIGSGKACWEQLLFRRGVKLTASDVDPRANVYFTGPYEIMDASTAVMHFPEADVLFVNWPRDFASDALGHFRGQHVISIGENGHDGCTGDIGGILEDSAEWRQIVSMDIPRWPGIWDNLVIYTRVAVELV